MYRRLYSDNTDHYIQFESYKELDDALIIAYSAMQINFQELTAFQFFFSQHWDNVAINGITVFEITTVAE